MNNQFDPYNNQFDPYNNQFNGNGMQGPGHQPVPYVNNRGNDNRGGGFFSFLIAVILLVGCSGLLMHFLGYIDLSEYLPILNKFTEVETNKPDTDNNDSESKDDSKDNKSDNKQEDKEEKNDENISSQEKELKKMCTSVDAKGKYLETNEKACFNKTCMLIDSDIYYSYDCETESFQKVSEDEIIANFDLNIACANVDGTGNYSNPDKNMSCSDSVCTYNYKDVSYSKVCNLDE